MKIAKMKIAMTIRKSIGVLVLALAAVSVLNFAAPESAFAAKRQMSSEAVKKYIVVTWEKFMPIDEKIKAADGTLYTVGKDEYDKVKIPVDDARKIIMIGRRSAHAQLCKLKKLSKLNYLTMIEVENKKKKWSRKQMLFISQLHLAVKMIITRVANLSLVDKVKKAKTKTQKKVELPTCRDDYKAKVKAQIEAYMKANPLPQKTAKTAKKTN